MTITMDLEFLTPRTVANTSGQGYSNIGAIILDNFIIVIDASIYGKTAQKFRVNLENHFGLPLKYLLYTHHHGDHIFGGRPFKDLTIISSKQTMENIKVKMHVEWKKILEEEDPLADDGLEILIPTISFTNKLIIRDEVLFIEIIHVGGHTSGSSYIHFPHEKVLFAGDLIFEGSFPYGGDPTCDPDKWIEQLELIRKMEPVETIIPGHGQILKSKKEIDKHIDFLKYLRKIIQDAIQEKRDPKSFKLPKSFQVSSEGRKSVTLENWMEFYQNK